MRILLVYPYFIEDRIQGEDTRAVPIGLYSIAAVLKENGHDVEVLNWHDIQGKHEKVRDTLLEKRPQVIGFSILNGNRWGGIEIARTAKEIDPQVKIVFGGIGASCLWEHFLKHFHEIDYVVTGEGEYAFLNLVRVLENEGSPEGVKGIVFKSDGKFRRTDPPELIQDLDNLPIPAKFFTYHHVSSSRGCAWRCAFCGSPAFWGGKIRFRSPSHFVEELEILYDKGITFFCFSDDTFTIDKKRVIEICRGIIEKKLKITWYAISRVDCVNEEMLLWMRKAGCIQISYGIESGSEKIRNALKKSIKTDQIKKAFHLTTKYGILSRAYFIYGCPGESWETIQETIDLIQEIKPLSAIFYILDIFPGTDLYEQLKKRSGVTDNIWLQKMEGIMYCETDSSLPDELVLAFGKKLRTSFYENVHSFALSVPLIDRKELYEEHADFCSRLGMTFSHGGYAKVDAIKEKDETAEKLFAKSLEYHPNHRAYLGMGIVKQKKKEYEESARILSEGLRHFPNSEDLTLCLGITYVNMRDYKKALTCFSKFPDSKVATAWMARCRDKKEEHVFK
jgi:anaerobic magnesium-protoporphyrin IX monomethyl ester cyclase